MSLLNKTLIHAALLGLTSLLIGVVAHAQTPSNKDLLQVETFFKDGKYEQVISTIERSAPADLNSEHYRLLTLSYLKDDLDDAEEAADKAIQVFPNNPDVYLTHARVMGAQANDSIFSALGYAEKALNSLQTAVTLSPEGVKYREALLSFYLNAPSIAGGDNDLAFEQVKLIEELDVVQGKIVLARYYRANDQDEKSLSVLLQANADFPNNIRLLDGIAEHYNTQEKYQQAIEYYTHITQINLVSPVDDEHQVIAEYENASVRQLNAHYQIGRSALLGNLMLDDGIEQLNVYIATIKEKDTIADFDLSSLPSLDWAKLRLSALMLANSQAPQAKAYFASINLDKNDDNMKKIYKALKKQLK
jgi:tetratricopeptide (TPR) repeat protein